MAFVACILLLGAGLFVGTRTVHPTVAPATVHLLGENCGTVFSPQGIPTLHWNGLVPPPHYRIESCGDAKRVYVDATILFLCGAGVLFVVGALALAWPARQRFKG